ncbi:MAG: hypothetical protein ACREAD_02740, partial [Nitrosopumilaceae archaeon]
SGGLGSSCDANLGDDFTGIWTDASTLVITGGPHAAGVTVGNLIITPVPNTGFKNSQGTVPVSIAPSPELTGSFLAPPAPQLIGFVITGTGANVFSIQDTFTIKFSEDTNMPSSSGTPGTINNVDMHSYFTFSPSLGSTSLTGNWITPSILKVAVNSVDGSNPALIGVTTVTPTPTANIQKVGGSQILLLTSTPLSGSFGDFVVSIPVSNGGTAVTVLPSGLTVSLETGSGSSGTITFNKTTSTSVGPNHSKLQFLGDVVEISGQSCSVANPCTVAFDFSSHEVNNQIPQIPYVVGSPDCGSSCPEVKIIHAQENATTFTDADLITPTLTLTSTGPCFTLPEFNNIPACEFHASAQITHPSRFAIGGIVLAVLGHGGGSSPPPSFTLVNLASDSSIPDNIKNTILNHDPLKPISPSNDTSIPYYPMSIDGKGYLLGGYTNTLQTVTEKTGVPVDLQFVTYADSIQHMALYINLHGTDPQIPDSDTYVIYDAGKPLQTVDPHGLFSGVTFDLVKDGNKYKIDYGIKFAKTMSTSDIIVRVWNERHLSSDVRILDAWQVVQNTNSQSTANSDTTLLNTATQTPSLNANSDMMSVIKKWGGYTSTSISDSELLKGMGINANHIPSWYMKTSKWVVDGDMTQQEFVNAIQYMYEKGIIK